jgi:uncharacterized protein YbcC (UPF0753/DUF2309 family)
VESRLARVIEHVAHLLPAQGPITIFIHHNTLHAFEHLPFEEAVTSGGELFGREPFLSEQQYREALKAGRIRDADLLAALRSDLGASGASVVGGFATREALRLEWLKRGVPEAAGEALNWLLSETSVLDALRPDLSGAARERVVGAAASADDQRRAVRALWEACRSAVACQPPAPARGAKSPVRHRDMLLSAFGVDADELVHPLLIRLSAAYLDQGIAPWPMPDRQRGFFACATRLYGLPFGSPTGWMRTARLLLTKETASERSALQSIAHSLERLGVEVDAWEEYLTAAALALRGWAGMMRQVEERPDRVPVHVPPATLTDFLAVRLLLDRAAASEVTRSKIGPGIDLGSLRSILAERLGTLQPPSVDERAWALFHLAQILGRGPGEIAALGVSGVADVLAEIDAFDGVTRRRLLHQAFERGLRMRFYDAVASHAAQPRGPRRFQAVFCLDEREESLRRHLEEVAPACETFGCAGFFGVAMYFRGADEVHARPLCPVGIQPEHEVEEIPLERADLLGLRARLRRAWGGFGLGMALGSRGIVRGTLFTVLLGAIAAVPLIFRVLSPRLAARSLHRGRRLFTAADRNQLALERRAGPPSLGRWTGYTTEEMAGIVRRVLEDAGLQDLAPLVVIVGHGSTSLNNPHESAHDCGACGGGRGGQNARAFAQMANHPDVRALLGRSGMTIPAGTWFVGAEHNTSTDAMDYFDLDRVPGALAPRLRKMMRSIGQARGRNARERCRKFRAAPLWYGEQLSLAHVEARAHDLAQTRPEYGHATNAFCVVGRRRRTRGLFLDRRAFLVSYDPTRDDDAGTILARLLAGVVPVVAGISLEYYFAFVDPTGHGCGSKLPHNVTALLGVMDGHASDLRTGLPRQMTEIHEPVRLTLLVETPIGTLRRVVNAEPALRRLVSNRWIVAAALDPDASVIHELRGEEVVRHVVESAGVPWARSSAECYQGRRGFVDFARIGPDSGADA